MKSAKEMFEELGYDLQTTDRIGNIFYISTQLKNNPFRSRGICFDVINKRFIADYNLIPMCVDMQTFKAIYKQLEELGWLE